MYIVCICVRLCNVCVCVTNIEFIVMCLFLCFISILICILYIYYTYTLTYSYVCKYVHFENCPILTNVSYEQIEQLGLSGSPSQYRHQDDKKSEIDPSGQSTNDEEKQLSPSKLRAKLRAELEQKARSCLHAGYKLICESNLK